MFGSERPGGCPGPRNNVRSQSFLLWESGKTCKRMVAKKNIKPMRGEKRTEKNPGHPSFY